MKIINDKDILSVISYYKNYKYLLILLYGITITSSITELLPTYFFGKIIDMIASADMNRVLYTILILSIIFLCNITLSFGETYISNYLDNQISKDIKNNLANSVLSSRLSSINSFRTGQVFQVIEEDSNILSKFIVNDILNFVISVVKSVVILVLIITISLKLTCITLISIPCYFLVSKVFEKYISSGFRTINTIRDKYTTSLQEMLLHIKEIKILNCEASQKSAYKSLLNSIQKVNLKLVKYTSLSSISSMFIGNISEWITLIYSTWLIINHQFTLGSYVSFKTYSQQVTQSIAQVVTFKLNLKKIKVSSERLEQILKLDLEERSSEDTTAATNSLSYTLNIDNISFRYNNHGKYILKGCSAEFNKKGLYGIVGQSGCGKSTLLNLIINLYTPDKGDIYIQNINIKDIKIDTLRNHIAYIQQSPYLFNGTIRENLLIGNNTATDDEIVKACQTANIDQYIQSLPDKYDTQLGELALKPSGGQKQRIAIARAVLQKAYILLLDEITSDLDGESEYYIMQSLKKLSEKCMIIMVAHRISTVEQIKNIYVMNNGHFEAHGTHEELLISSQIYRNLFAHKSDVLI